MQEKEEKDDSIKKEHSTPKEDPIKKEDSYPTEDSINKEDPLPKEDSINKKDSSPKEDSANKEDSAPKEAAPPKTHFSQERINEIVQRLRKKLSEHYQLQNEGKIPFYKRVPITVMEIPYVMLVINRERGTASALMKEIRMELGKKPRQKISVTEFCNHTGIPISDVRDALNHLT